MTKYLSLTCLVLVLLGISGGTTNAKVLGSRAHRRFSQQGRDIEPNNRINIRSPNVHIVSPVGIAASRTHNGVPFPDSRTAIGVIISAEGSNVLAQEQGRAAPLSPINFPGNSPAIIKFQSGPCTPVPGQSAGHVPLPIPFRLATEFLDPVSVQLSPAAPAQTAPFEIPTTQDQQADIATDACNCHCLCPFDFFGIPAVNLATTVDPGGLPTPTTLATVASLSIPGNQSSSSAAAGPFFPAANDTLTASIAFPDISEVQTSSTSAMPVTPISLPAPPEDGATTATGVPISPVGNEASSTAGFATPYEPLPAAPTEIVSTNADPTEPAATQADATQPAASQATATAEDVAVASEDPATITDADFTQVTDNTEFIAKVTNAAAETIADSTQTGLTVAPVETAASELESAASETFDINTLTLHSALTLRLGG
ncbi:hypothetical protein AJ78_04816 [Emergomyces pasteurianus Ep9510]|uniref:Uncharacterized protein n=1 Tax=Emergomyces pasteurianus Ep9510 TaxID=1447872 RepID=A0A1J9QI58_9EURO|nr:hypothetical protein AJ78_04816 [Emergomyces pasteurianus Ep9510]